MKYAKEAMAQSLQASKLNDLTPTEQIRALVLQIWDAASSDVARTIGDTAMRNIYLALMHQARNNVSQSMTWPGNAKVFTKENEKEKKNALTYLAYVLMLAACVVGFLTSRPVVGILSAVALALLLLSQLRKPAKKSESYALATWQPKRILSSLIQMASAIDDDAENLYAAIPSLSADMKLDGLDMAVALLRLSYQGGAPLPPQADTALSSYLARNGLETVQFDDAHRAMFTVLPANGQCTLEPALIRQGKLVHPGVACEKEEI